MPRSTKQWEPRDDLRPLLKKAKKLFPTILAHVDYHRIFICSFTAQSSDKSAAIQPNRYPWCLITPEYDYCIKVWHERWEDLEYEKQLYIMLHELLHIPEGGQEEFHPNWRKTIKHDIQDFLWLRETYGLKLGNVKDVLKGEKHLVDLKAWRKSFRKKHHKHKHHHHQREKEE